MDNATRQRLLRKVELELEGLIRRLDLTWLKIRWEEGRIVLHRQKKSAPLAWLCLKTDPESWVAVEHLPTGSFSIVAQFPLQEFHAATRRTLLLALASELER